MPVIRRLAAASDAIYDTGAALGDQGAADPLSKVSLPCESHVAYPNSVSNGSMV